MFWRALFVSVVLLVAIPSSFAQKKNKKTNAEASTPGKTAADLEREALFIEALQLKTLGNNEDAIALLKQILNKDPKNDAVAYELTRIYYDLGNLQQARTYGELALKLNPANEWYYIYLAETKGEMGDYVGGAEIYGKLIKAFPKSYDYYYDWAYMLGAGRKFQEALAAYTQLEQKIGLNDELLLQKQSILLRLNKTEEAAADVEKMIRNNPGDPRYFGMLGELYEANQMPEKAIKAYSDLLELDPENAQALSALAEIYRKKGDEAKYQELITRIFQNKETDIDTKILTFIPFLENLLSDSTKGPEVLKMADMILAAHPGDAKALAARADVLYNTGKKSEARLEYIKAIESGECPMTVWLQLFTILYDDKDFDALRQYATLGTEKNPMEPIPPMYKGLACQQLKDFSCAVEAFKTASGLADFNGNLKNQILTSLGDSYFELKDYEHSDSAYEAALELDPNNAYTLNNYAYYLSERGDKLEKAERMSKKSLLFEEDNPSFLDTYGWIMYKLKRYPEAKNYIEQALEKTEGSDKSVLYDHYGDILFRMGQTDKAVENWKNALEKTEGDRAILEEKIKNKAIPEMK